MFCLLFYLHLHTKKQQGILQMPPIPKCIVPTVREFRKRTGGCQFVFCAALQVELVQGLLAIRTLTPMTYSSA
jgi:hypothetical protein